MLKKITEKSDNLGCNLRILQIFCTIPQPQHLDGLNYSLGINLNNQIRILSLLVYKKTLKNSPQLSNESIRNTICLTYPPRYLPHAEKSSTTSQLGMHFCSSISKDINYRKYENLSYLL